MDGFRIASAYVEVDADTARADAKIAALRAELSAVAARTYHARVEIDSNAVTEAAKIRAALGAIGDLRIGTESGALGEIILALGVMQRDLAVTTVDLKIQTGLLRDIRDLLIQSAGAATLLAGAMNRAGESTTRAGTGATIAGRGFFGLFGALTRNVGVWTALHYILMATGDFLAVALPASIATAAGAFVAYQGIVEQTGAQY